jgi:hypothetical protein
MSESIYSLVPEEYVAPEKPPMYRSKHDPSGPLTGSTFGTHGTTQLIGAGSAKRASKSTFGPPGGKSKPSTHDYLKGHSGDAPTAEPMAFLRVDGSSKPGVPVRTERPVFGLKTSKNFITANAVEAILQVPDSKANLAPDYLRKADYGKVPGYLGQVKEEIRRENEMIDAYVKEQMGLEEEAADGVESMSEGERGALVAALKRKWDSVNTEYQKICHMVKLDTVGKVKRKEGMEQELKVLEADIDKLMRPGPLYVSGY